MSVTAKRNRYNVLAILFLVLTFVAVGWVTMSKAQADDDDHDREHKSRSKHRSVLQQQPLSTAAKSYQSECGSCHLAYEPRLLSASTWQRQMQNLKNHYGTDASLEPAKVKEIGDFLQAYADKDDQENPPQDRITRTEWFVDEHDEIPASVFKRASIKSAANCAACHTRAEQGRFSEHDVRIPK